MVCLQQCWPTPKTLGRYTLMWLLWEINTWWDTWLLPSCLAGVNTSHSHLSSRTKLRVYRFHLSIEMLCLRSHCQLSLVKSQSTVIASPNSLRPCSRTLTFKELLSWQMLLPKKLRLIFFWGLMPRSFADQRYCTCSRCRADCSSKETTSKNSARTTISTLLNKLLVKSKQTSPKWAWSSS